MYLRDPLSVFLADTRYLIKATGATDQTIAGTGTITISAYSITWTAGSLTMAAGTASIANSTATTTLTVTNTNGPGGGIAGSFGRTNAGVVLQAGTVATPTNFTVTAAGAGSFASTLGVTGLATLTAGFTANAASTIVPAANAGLDVNVGGATITSGQTYVGPKSLFRDANGYVEIGTLNSTTDTGIVIFGTGTVNRATIGWDQTNTRPFFYSNVASAWAFGNTTLNPGLLFTPNTCTFASQVASGANTGFTFNATNGPDTTFVIQNSSTNRYVFGGSTSGSITFGLVNTAGAFLIRGSANNFLFDAPSGANAWGSLRINTTESATFPGATPSSVAGNGTNAVNGTLGHAALGGGGASSGVTGQTGGTGSTWTITSGAGGAVAGASGIGGAGGGLTVTGGAGGNGAATGGAGGSVSLTAGNAGTGGNANAGTITLTTGTATGSGTTAAVKLRNGTTTDADVNLNVLGAAPTNVANGDFWITDIGGVRRLNARIGGVSYSIIIA